MGGGIYARDSDVYIEGSTVTGNSASLFGGGIYVVGTLSVNDSHITDNTAMNAGGGVYCSETLILSDSTLSGNTVGSEESYYIEGGGAVFGLGDVTITNCVVSDNDMIVKGPTSNSGHGGGVYAVGALNILDSVFSSNRADLYGGGIYAQGPMTISRSEFYGNESKFGGATYCDDVATMTNVFYGGNTSEYGGALDLRTDAILSNCAFVGNGVSQQYGGVIYGSGDWTIANSTFAQNTGGYGRGAIDAGGTVNVTNSLFWQNEGGDFGGDGDYVVTGSLVGMDPLFRENPSDGGDGWGDDPDTPDVEESANDNYGDLRLTASSPAVNAGQAALLAADVTDLDGDGDTEEPVPFDMNGEARVWGDSPDAGACEYQADATPGREAPAVVVTTPDDVSDFYDGAISLREAIWYAGTDGLETRITFAPALEGATIVLNGTELLIDKNDASSLDSHLDADGRSRAFQVRSSPSGSSGSQSRADIAATAAVCDNRGDTTVLTLHTITDSFPHPAATLRSVNSVFLANAALRQSTTMANWHCPAHVRPKQLAVGLRRGFQFERKPASDQ